MSALVDTSVLVDYLRGIEQARALLVGALERGEAVSASWLTRIELAIGTRRNERRRTDALIAAIRWLMVDPTIADEAEALAKRFARSHSGIDAVDYCIAATARVHKLELWTLNVRHFPMFPKLAAPW
ncbi:MAG: type II toxin-antitoxin system VapC family toxin [Actinomycetota bacterium]